MKKLSTTKRIKCDKCNAFVRENLMAKHTCTNWTAHKLDIILERKK